MSKNTQKRNELNLHKPLVKDSNCEACVIGLGSLQGNDAVGLHVVEGLSRLLPLSVQVAILNEPTRLLSFLYENRYVWIVDACRSDQPLGTITRITWPDKQIARNWSLSGHGIGMAEILKLADTLYAERSAIVVYTINIGNAPTKPDGQLAAEVVDAAKILRLRLVEEIVAHSEYNSDKSCTQSKTTTQFEKTRSGSLVESAKKQ